MRNCRRVSRIGWRRLAMRRRTWPTSTLPPRQIMRWGEALGRGAALMTKDRDFVTLRIAKNSGPPIVWLRFGNCDTETLIARVLGALDSIVAAVERGESIVEVVAR
jgi:predicted nuclease of predicted toxin-antitoxin system